LKESTIIFNLSRCETRKGDHTDNCQLEHLTF
jgi:hypothetical protein